TPLVEAQAGESDWGGELRLVSNAAWFGGDALADWNDANKTNDENKPHTTRGTAEYMLTTFDAGGAPMTASFKMEYAPFGLGDTTAWAAIAATGNAAPVWTIRNGLNDVAQDADTDFAAYGTTAFPSANANGAISVAVVNPAASLGAGLYEDGNPWPIAVPAMTGASANDLTAALTYLDAHGAAGKYGSYAVRLGVDPTLPVYPGVKITLGGIPSANSYAAIKQTRIIIEGTSNALVVMPLTDVLWTLLDNNTVGNGSGVAQELVKSAAPGSTEWVVPWDDDYEIELNGAQGGSGSGTGGKGGAIKGTIHLTQGAIYEIRVGGAGAGGKVGGSEAAGGYNGGGKGGKGLNTYPGGSSGGGASDMRTSGGDYTTRILVAGGGGGSAKAVGGAGYGGGNAGNGNGGYGANGGNGGAGATMTAYYATGIGGNGATTGYGDEGGAGGGGGYYGANATGRGVAGGGGSSWANGSFFDVTPAANGAGARSGNGSVRIIALMR
ncbi:MAG: hypothetical protein LBS82_02515, partial [Spirochaetaceae bacterium]|nr:hypothetical protein [Spirochaetaceae bacterium]